MPTPTTKDAKQALYAVAGAADLAVSTLRHLPQEAGRIRARNSARSTRTSARAASTTVRRAAAADTKAAKAAASKVGDK